MPAAPASVRPRSSLPSVSAAPSSPRSAPADKIDKAKALGADHVINYREDRFEGVVRKLTKKKGVDVVFEHVGADTWAGSMLSLKRGGRLVTCGSTSGVSTQMNLMQLFQQQLRLIGSFGCRMENMADALQKMAAGHVAPVVDTEIGFDDIGTALARMESRDVFGKIILQGLLTAPCAQTAEAPHHEGSSSCAQPSGCRWPTTG